MNKRILIVDDQHSVVLFLRDILGELGFEVFSASTGTEGFALIQQCGFEGVILDLDMPKMEGLTMLERLRALTYAVPVIVMSGDPTRSAMIQAIKAGANDYLLKPISYEILKFKCLRLFT